MGRLSDRRKAKKPKVKAPADEPVQISVEAKTAMALAFAGVGGVPALVAWARTNERTRTEFYRLYAKTLPMTVAGEVRATNDGEDAGAALERILLNLIAERQAEAAGVVIDVQANPGVVDHAPFTRVTNAAPADESNVVQLNATRAAESAEARPEPVTIEVLSPEQARQRAMAPLPRPTSTELSTTEKFYEYSSHRSDWWANLPGKI